MWKALMVFQYHSEAFDVGLRNSVNDDVFVGCVMGVEKSIRGYALLNAPHLRLKGVFNVL